MSGTAQSMLRRSGAKLTTTRVTDSPIFITLRALGGAGSAISRNGTYPRTPFSPIEMYAPWDEYDSTVPLTLVPTG